MKKSIVCFVALGALASVAGCTSERVEKSRTTSSSIAQDGSEDTLTNARIFRSPTQIRLESTAREACKGRQTILDIRVDNSSATDGVSLTAVAHGYRNGELVPVQITRISDVYVGPIGIRGIKFDGEYPATKGSAIEVVSVTLDANPESTFQDLGVNAKFLCGEEDRSDPGVEPGPTPGTGSVQDPSQISCADLAALRGAAVPLCEFNGNGGCGGSGSRTNDCDHCCQAVGPGQTEPL